MVLHLEERDLKSLAEAGDLAAIGEVIDRVEGKPRPYARYWAVLAVFASY
jgi:hypothetical protein